MGGSLEAVLWDFGGVLTTSPFDTFAAYEVANGLETGFIRRLNATNPDANAWARFERSEIGLEQFVALFEEEAAAAGSRIDGAALIRSLRGEIRPEMVEALRRCHERFKTGLLTNNFVSGRRPEPGGASYDDVLEHFDVIVESSKVGYRKPDARFYQTACDQLGVDPAEAIFLDDLGVNLKPARAMGMRTIKVTDPATALAELESVVGFPLR